MIVAHAMLRIAGAASGVVAGIAELVRLTEIAFTSESIENVPSGWRARETYHPLSANEWSETFELAEPGREFTVYSEKRFRRRR